MANQQDVNAGQTGNRERSGGLAAQTQEAAEQMKGAASRQIAQVGQRAESARAQAVQRLRRVALELRHGADTLQSEDELAARLAHRTSDSIDRVAGYIRSADAHRLRDDTQRLVRRRPALFFGSAFALGLALARLFKRSGSEHGVSDPFSEQDTGTTLENWRNEAPSYGASEQSQKGFSP